MSSEYALMHKEVFYDNTRCDLMGFSQHYRELICIELKQSVSDFHSDAALTFVGNRNYYAMPYDIYEKVKEEIPKDIGVYVLPRENILAKNQYMLQIKRCRHHALHCDERTIMWEMQNSMKANPNQIVDALSLDIKSIQDDEKLYKWARDIGIFKDW